ncbi:MAG: hypothetical protein RR510_15730 [Morganella sp. (in: enterobacteria)]|uniref:Uncharacterized protein n=1 Tax=Morganella psychrotolerans TaxID=368603 RepID=A0A1B8HRC6_9GAMM|nr:hypothetical protein [Morganella psychrotolerans]OBU12080.1 hypothetical protein AYY18_17150 [Morganella psychrotolerans]
MYRFYIQDALPAGCLPAYTLPKPDQPHYYELDENVLNAALNIMQITDVLDTDELLDDDCFNRIWLKSELTPARASEVYHFLFKQQIVEPIPSPDEIAAFKQAREDEIALLSLRSPKDGCIPVHKFATQDAWRIVPQECLLIVDMLNEHLLDDHNEVVKNIASLCHISHKTLEQALKGWRGFNKFAAKHGGYQVC